MVRRLDDTKVGEYKNSWFFELVQLLLSILGCIAVFLIPITYNVVKGESETTMTPMSPVNYLFSDPAGCYTKVLSIAIVVFFGFLLLNIFALLAIPKVSKSVYVKVSKIIEGILALVCIALLSYYMVHLFNSNYFVNMDHVEGMYKLVIIYIGIIGFALINSIFVCFTSKKVSIYD